MDLPAAAHDPAMEGDEPPRDGAAPIRAKVEGNRLELIESGADRLRAILALIGSARTSIRLLFYMFNSDSAGLQVRDALVAAAGRGVKVTVLLDGFGCSGADPAFFLPLQDAGGKFCQFHPKYGRRYLVRNHQKLVIADEQQAIIGGANIHDSYLTDDGPDHWRDLWLLIDGPAVKRAAQYFDAVNRWTVRKHAKLKDLRRLVFRFSQSQGAIQWKFSGPFARRNPWPTALAREIVSGSRFDLISAYFSPPGRCFAGSVDWDQRRES
jgi:cardiolipin synthase A/B